MRAKTVFFSKSKDKPKPSIVILTSDDPHHNFLITKLLSEFRIVGIVIEPGREQHRLLWKKKKYIDWMYRWYHRTRNKFSGSSKHRQQFFNVKIDYNTLHTEVIQVKSINASAVKNALKRWQADLCICCGTMFIGKSVTKIAKNIINIHGGYLPDYKGNHCIFFAYYEENYTKIGATLHFITSHLDSGDIIEVVRVPVYPQDNDEHLYSRSVYAAILRLVEILRDFEKGIPINSKQQLSVGRMFRHNSRSPYHDLRLWLRRKLKHHKIPHLSLVLMFLANLIL